MGPSSQLGSDPIKNVVQCGTAFGPSGYGQIIWDFQTGPCEAMVVDAHAVTIEAVYHHRLTTDSLADPITV